MVPSRPTSGVMLVCSLALAVIAVAGCGRTDLQLSEGDSPSTGGRRAALDASVDSASGGRGSGSTGGRGGTGGRAGVGSGGRPGTGGRRGAADGGIPTTDASIPDLPPSTPGTVLCGSEMCDTKVQSCCVTVSVGAVARCVPTSSTCGGAALGCDEPADCPGGFCCFGLQAGAGTGVSVGSRCVPGPTCVGPGRFVVCRTNSDCTTATPFCCAGLAGVPICQAACR